MGGAISLASLLLLTFHLDQTSHTLVPFVSLGGPGGRLEHIGQQVRIGQHIRFADYRCPSGTALARCSASMR